jgi:hypothetical protein
MRGLRSGSVNMSIAIALMRCLSQRYRMPGLSGENGDHTAQRLISAAPRLLWLQRG